MALGKNKQQYSSVNRIYNVDIVENLEDADPEHYALILDPSKSAIIDVPLMNIIKIYLEEPRKVNGVTTVQLELPEGMTLGER